MECKVFSYEIASEHLIFQVKRPSKLSQDGQDELLVFKYIESKSYKKSLKFRYSEKATKIRKRIPLYFDVAK